MAKGQKRSNKEVKKPKQVKPKPPGTASVIEPGGRVASGGQEPEEVGWRPSAGSGGRAPPRR